MSVIQKIRDKYARWAVIAIGLSLLGFIMMDAFAGRTGLFSNRSSNTLGKVNGHTIDRIDFDRKIKQQEQAASQQGRQVGEDERQQIMEYLWNQEVEDVVLQEQYEDLGLTVTDKELNDMIYNNPPDNLKQQFTDPKTGEFSSTEARRYFSEAKKDPTRKDDVERYFEYLKSERLKSKYTALMTASIFFPKWFLEKRNADNSLIARASIVAIPYSTISDSTIKVSNDEVKDYINDHKELFESKIESRAIDYVLFSAAPSSADSAAARANLLKLKPAFDSTHDVKQFLESNNSAFPFYDSYLSKAAIQQPNKDSILSVPVGQIYGPYLDAAQNTGTGLYVMSKIIDVKQLPDTVKARHILIATAQQTQTGGFMQVRDDSTAKHLIDSIQGLLSQGQSFDSLAAKFSEDPGSKEKGGVYENVTTGMMMPEFNDYIFMHKTGDIGVVKTNFGYHLIEILSQKGSSPAYKIAYMTQEIAASAVTDQQAHNAANLFAGDSRNEKLFDENYEKNLKGKGIPKLVAPNITAMDYNIQGIPGTARSFVRNIFDADKGDVLGPERVGDNYVVAVVTEVNEAGEVNMNAARAAVEPLIRNRKKAEQIKKNIGTVTTPEAVATKMSLQVQTLDSLRLGGGPALGYEPKVLGAIFNPANNGKVIPEAIAGTSGVYVIRVESVTTTPVETASIEDQRKMLQMRMQQDMMNQMQRGGNPVIDVLKQAASVKDYRAKYF